MAATEGTAAFREAGTSCWSTARTTRRRSTVRLAPVGAFQLCARLVRRDRRDNDSPALWIVEEDGSEQRSRSRRWPPSSVAGWCGSAAQAGRPDRDDARQPGGALDTILAVMKLGAVIIPATPLLARRFPGQGDPRRCSARHRPRSAAERFAEVGADGAHRGRWGPSTAGTRSPCLRRAGRVHPRRRHSGR